MRVTLVIGHLGLGGAERMLCFMADYWAAKSWAVQLIILENDASKQFYFPSSAVQMNGFNLMTARKHGIPKLRTLSALMALRDAIKHTTPDVVIAFMNTNNIYTLLATFGMAVPIIACERSEPQNDILLPTWRQLRRLTYPLAARVVTQSSTALTYLRSNMTIHGCVIPNPVLVPRNTDGRPYSAPTDRPIKVALAVGRLAEVKQYHLLIQAFAQLAPHHADWSLEIWGDGPERDKLLKIITATGLQDRVSLPGITKVPYETMMRGDLFVLSSRYEGFPNALCEAMACGLPVVSFDCPGGVRDIVRHGIDGFLSPPGDVRKLAETMSHLMGDTERRRQMAARAPEICDRFNVDVIMERWEAMIHQVVGK